MVAVERLAGTLVAGLPHRGRPADHLRAAGPGARAGGPGPSRPSRVADPGRPPLARRLGEDPPVLSAVAASGTRQRAGAAGVCTPAGQWLVLHGARLDGDPQARVSVIIEPLPTRRPGPAAGRRLRAVGPGAGGDRAGVRGHRPARSARAKDLALHRAGAPDVHLRQGRCPQPRELVERVFFRHCLPANPRNDQPREARFALYGPTPHRSRAGTLDGGLSDLDRCAQLPCCWHHWRRWSSVPPGAGWPWLGISPRSLECCRAHIRSRYALPTQQCPIQRGHELVPSPLLTPSGPRHSRKLPVCDCSW